MHLSAVAPGGGGPPGAPRRRRVLVTGSRRWDDVETIRAALLHLERWAGDLRPVLVTGRRLRGADAIAEQVARERGCYIEGHLARWHGSDGHLDRAAGTAATPPWSPPHPTPASR